MDKNIFLKNLNCFIPLAFLCVTAISGIIFTVIFALSMLIYPELKNTFPSSPQVINVLSKLLALTILIFYWRKVGLFITSAKEGKENRFRFGHALLAIANIGILLFIVTPIILTYIFGMRDAGLLWLGFAFVGPAAGILWIIGLIMVYTARAAEKAETDDKPAITR